MRDVQKICRHHSMVKTPASSFSYIFSTPVLRLFKKNILAVIYVNKQVSETDLSYFSNNILFDFPSSGLIVL